MRNQNNGISRRAFLGGAIVAGAAATAGMVGCTPSKPNKQAPSTEESHAGSEVPIWLGEADDIDEASIVETAFTDLLIIGAGNGGMMAAVTAMDNRMDFIIAEKNDFVAEHRGYIGSVGSRAADAAGITVDRKRLSNELARYASYKCKQKLIDLWIEKSGETVDYLEDLYKPTGVSVTAITDEHADSGSTTGYYKAETDTRLWTVEDAANIIDRNKYLESILNDGGVEVTFGHELIKLEREGNGAVTGAIFSTADGYRRISAKNTILATGGYAANPEMFRALNPLVDKCITAASWNPSCDGAGIKAAMHIGAAKCLEPAPMIFDRGVVAPGVDAGYQGEGEKATLPGTVFQFNLGSQPFLCVNRDGERFVNESIPYDFKCFAATENKGGVWCQVFDSEAKKDVMRFATTGCSVWTRVSMSSDASIEEVYANEIEQGLLIKGDTIEELADGLGLPVDQFRATVDRYNDLYDLQLDEDFGKESYRLSQLRTPPYFGAWYGASLLTTLDGLEINEHLQVLDENDVVIEGLYAVGDCSGSFFSGNYPEYIVGAACGRTVTFGRHAVNHIAGVAD